MRANNGSFNQEHKQMKEINLKEIFGTVWRYSWVIVIVTALCTFAGYRYTASQLPLYQSSTRIIIEAGADKMKTLQVIIKDSTILEKVIEELQLPISPESLAGAITVTSIENSEVVSISTVYPDPELAAMIANTTASVFKEEIPKITGFKDVRYLSEAKVNGYPINMDRLSATIKAGMAGFLISIGLVFLLNAFDYRLRKDQEIEEFIGYPVIGRISYMNTKNTGNLKKEKKLSELTGQSVKAENKTGMET